MDYTTIESDIRKFNLRPFMVDLIDKFDERIKANQGGEPIIVCLDAFPGSGKTLASLMLVNHLRLNGFIGDESTVCYVPKLNLRDQYEEDSVDALREWKSLLGIGPAYAGENGEPFFYEYKKQRNSVAVCTYSSLVSNPEHHRRQIESMPKGRLLILDECDCLEQTEDSEGNTQGNVSATEVSKLIPLFDYVLLMSGTFYRTGRELILQDHISYKKNLDEEGKPYYVPKNRVSATYADGVSGEYLRNFMCNSIHHNGTIHVIDHSGKNTPEEIDYNSADEDCQKYLGYALRNEVVWGRIIDHFCGGDFGLLAHRKIDPEALGIVCLPSSFKGSSKPFAEKVQHYIEARFGLKCVIALSEDGAVADNGLTEFREQGRDGFPRKYDILLTIAKAHVGFSQPRISHVAMLTPVRSKRFVIQAIMRAGRVCYTSNEPKHKQHFHLFTLNDPAMMEIAEFMTQEKIKGQSELNGGGGCGSGEKSEKSTMFEADPEYSDFVILKNGEYESSIASAAQRYCAGLDMKIETALQLHSMGRINLLEFNETWPMPEPSTSLGSRDQKQERVGSNKNLRKAIGAVAHRVKACEKSQAFLKALTYDLKPNEKPEDNQVWLKRLNWYLARGMEGVHKNERPAMKRERLAKLKERMNEHIRS